VFAGLVDNPKLLVLRCLRVCQNLIDLSPLQGDFIPLVSQADDESFFGWIGEPSVNVSLDLELFTPNSVSFVPVYLG
jgi:hypothetical protein